MSDLKQKDNGDFKKSLDQYIEENRYKRESKMFTRTYMGIDDMIGSFNQISNGFQIVECLMESIHERLQKIEDDYKSLEDKISMVSRLLIQQSKV